MPPTFIFSVILELLYSNSMIQDSVLFGIRVPNFNFLVCVSPQILSDAALYGIAELPRTYPQYSVPVRLVRPGRQRG